MSDIFVKIGCGQWGELSVVLGQIELGLKQTKEIEEVPIQEEAQLVWLMLLAGIFTECGDYGISAESLPQKEYIEPLFDIMAATNTDDVFLMAAKAVLAINMHFDDPKTNPVMAICGTLRKAEHFGTILVHLINEQACPYKDVETLKQCLSCVRDLFESSKETAHFFYTNDLNVLVDIILQEVKNLPPEDEIRVSYLQCLRALIQNSPWMMDGRYRRHVRFDAGIRNAECGMRIVLQGRSHVCFPPAAPPIYAYPYPTIYTPYVMHTRAIRTYITGHLPRP